MTVSKASGYSKSSARNRLLAAGMAVLTAAGAFWLISQPSKDGDVGRQRQAKSGAPATEGAPSAVMQAGSVERSPILAEASSDPRAAMLRVGEAKGVLEPNARGEFPQLPIEASETIDASVPFPEAKPGERIAIQSEDGGMLTGNAAKGFAALDENRRVHLRYQASSHEGLYRVTLRRGGESRVLKFWIGPEPPILARQ